MSAVPAWLVWLLVAALLAAGEVATVGLVLGLFAVGAVVAALVSLVAPAVVQVLAFVLSSVALLLLVRPVAKRHLRTPQAIRTGTEALVGAKAVVLERVDARGGQVKLGGEIWSARAFDESQVIEPGTTVEVYRIEGATALVYE
jgi:membrane protein implicated in regulation of membrane protease activity